MPLQIRTTAMKIGQPTGMKMVKMIDQMNSKLDVLGHTSRNSLRIKLPGIRETGPCQCHRLCQEQEADLHGHDLQVSE